MALYESIFIIRQDMSSVEVDKIIDDFKKLIENYNGSVIKTEYWGLRSLAYIIDGNKKGHYYLIGMEASTELLRELDRKIKLNENVIRNSVVRVEAITNDPSAILRDQAEDYDIEEIEDVTILKKI